MLDTMTLTKVASGFLGAFLIYLLSKWGVQELYATDVHYDDEHVPGYSIEVVEDTGPAEDVVEVAFADVYATADAGAGERNWRQCAGCHNNENSGSGAAGPMLFGVVGRDVASLGDFGYSDALTGIEGEWTPEMISEFIENPRDYAPGTAMGYSGMSDVEDRANLIAYLATLN